MTPPERLRCSGRTPHTPRGIAAAGRLRIAITCGDPAGVGPELVVKALAAGVQGVEPVLVGPEAVWRAGARVAGTDLARVAPDGVVPAGDGEDPDWGWGRPTAGSGKVAARAVEAATAMALAGDVAAVVTAPLSKEGLRAAGRPFAGHTELLEALCGGRGRAFMMLAGERLRVVLVTTHLALGAVPAAITRERVLAAVEAAHRGLQGDLGVPSPRLGVAALNPHGGEGGLLGREEIEVIGPALEDARRRGIDARGPVPADSLFHRAVHGEFDAVVCMYHDQGLGPLKLLHFHDGVNITLGLPIVRTSPDHGTAFDLSGRGTARPDSTRQALRWAAAIARRRAAPAGAGRNR